MKSVLYNIALLGTILLTFACNKTDFNDDFDATAPVFIVDGLIDNQSINLQAGMDGAYMFTEIENFNNVPLSTGELEDKVNSVKIQLFGNNIDLIINQGKFNTLSEYSVAHSYGEEPLLNITPEHFTNYSAINDIKWTVNNEVQSGSSLLIFEPGKHTICSEITFNNGESAKTCNDVIVGYKKNVFFHILQENLANENVNFFIESNYEIESVEWYIDNQLFSNNESFNIENSPSIFTLKAVVRFFNGTIETKEIYVNSTNENYSIEDFTIIGNHTEKEWDNSITVEIKSNGITYQSLANSPSSLLQVSEITEFKPNSNGEKVKLIKGVLDTEFINLSTGEIVQGNLSIQFGLAY